tara:strand:- start:1839 stop:2207 length:369 start_codon:yes stop_codon:yes gene_type:complete
MSKNIPDLQIDGMLQLVEGDVLNICSAQPTNYTEAITTYQLASFAVVGGNYTLAAGDVSGRKNTLAALTGANIDNTGTATHAAVTKIVGTELKLVTTTVSQLLTSGGTVDTSAFDHEIQQAT